MDIENGKFYFIKDEFFELIQDEELCKNKESGIKRPCFYCFKDKTVDTLVFGFVEGEKRVFLIQNMFPTKIKYIIEKYVKNKRDVTINEKLNKELKYKANKILTLVEKGYKNLVFPDIMKIKEILNNVD